MCVESPVSPSGTELEISSLAALVCNDAFHVEPMQICLWNGHFEDVTIRGLSEDSPFKYAWVFMHVQGWACVSVRSCVYVCCEHALFRKNHAITLINSTLLSVAFWQKVGLTGIPEALLSEKVNSLPILIEFSRKERNDSLILHVGGHFKMLKFDWSDTEEVSVETVLRQYGDKDLPDYQSYGPVTAALKVSL